jgi:hypothetical protein
MKTNKLQLKKSTIRVLLDESSLRRVVGGLTAFQCTGATCVCASDFCGTSVDPGTGCTQETEAPAFHCSGADCAPHDTITLGP